MGFNLSSAVPSVKTVAHGAAIAVDLMPPIFYEETTSRVALIDAQGNVTGYDDVTSGYGYTSTTHYDTDLNYLGSEFVDVRGYKYTTTQTPLYGSDGQVSGYLVVSRGGDDQSQYSSNDQYDSAWSLTRSEYSDSSGYQSNMAQTTLTDSSGKITGYEMSSSGGDATSNYQSTASYDADWNVIQMSYSDSSGYQSSTVQTTLTNDAGKITGYEVTSSGSGGSQVSYTSVEYYNADHNLVSSDYSDSNGYHSTYQQATQLDSSGAVTGYVITSTWSDGSHSYESTQHYDANWTWLSSENSGASDPGPEKLPLLEYSTANKMETVTAAAKDTSLSNDQIHAGKDHKMDILIGGKGDDVFVVSDRSDCVIDDSNNDNDTVVSSDLSLNLGNSNYSKLENASVFGNEDLNLTGNKHANVLSGNAGDNIINGKGGADTLFGGAGNDVFAFGAKLDHANIDTITDFVSGSDAINLSKKIFTAYTADADLTSSFVSDAGVTAHNTSDHFLYDTTTGNLYYDADGIGQKVAIQFATLTGHPTLVASDLHIY